jgi:hypothetical protein
MAKIFVIDLEGGVAEGPPGAGLTKRDARLVA